MKKFKVLNAILHADIELYEDIANCSRNTWMKNTKEDVFSFFYKGGAKNNYIDSDVLHLNAPDYWMSGGSEHVSCLKMLKAFDFCLKNFDFDFLLRTASCTYVNYDLLLNFLKELPEDFQYGGRVASNLFEGKPIRWVLGHAVLMSKSFIEIVVENKLKIMSYKLIDDISLGKLAQEKNINASSIDRIGFEKWILDQEKLNLVKDLPVCIRCKPTKLPKDMRRQNWLDHTCGLFETINDRFKKESKNMCNK